MKQSECKLCPRNCQIDRKTQKGFCGGGSQVKIARAALHFGEEPCISGKQGSGTVFFSGCPLKCVFCQNANISHENYGMEITTKRLADIFLELQDMGAHNVNLVSPTQYQPQIIEALDMVRHKLVIPVVYNTSGYEKAERIRELKDYVDIYLTDMKYYNSEIARQYSAASDYDSWSFQAVKEMILQTGKPVFEDDLLKKGTIIRHLVLPGNYRDSIALFEALSHTDFWNPDTILVSLMRQYTPNGTLPYQVLNRKLSTYEYEKVLDKVSSLNVQGYLQEKGCETKEYIPLFDLTGVEKKENENGFESVDYFGR